MKKTRTRSIRRWLVPALVVLALAATAGPAAASPPARVDPSDVVSRWVAGHEVPVDGPDVISRWVENHRILAVESSGGGSTWGTTGFVAGGVLAALAAACGVLTVVRHRRPVATSSA